MFRNYSISMSGTSLMRALDTQDRQETARILQTMPSEVSMRDSEDRVALHYAAETMDLDMFEKIYEQDTTLVDSQDKNGHTPLLMSVMGGRTDLVEFLLNKGANMNHVDRDGHSVVHWAVVCGHLETLSFLIAKEANVNTPDLNNATPLHYATAWDEVPHEVALAILHTLLRAGADPNARDKDQRTPILWCASNGNLEAMTSLSQAGGNLQVVDRDQLAVTHCAASHGYPDIIEYYLESVPRNMVDLKDRAGSTALFYAVTYGHYEAAKRLLAYGSNPNKQDFRLRTASHCASAKGQLRMLKLLKQYEASIEIQNYRGDLPIHEAVQAGSKEVVDWLLEQHPSSLDAANHQGRTCLHLASATGNIEMVVLLCTKQCFVDPLMLFGNNLYTPLDLAKQKDHQVVVEYLTLRHNAKLSAEVDDEIKQKSKMTFEEQIVQGKLARGRHLQKEGSVTEMESKKKHRRRRSSEMSESDRKGEKTKTKGVNTSGRRITSAGPRPQLGKATSTTDLKDNGSRIDQAVIKEMIKEQLSEHDKEQTKPPRLVNEDENEENEENRRNGDLSEIEDASGEELRDDHYEDLPGISDSSEDELGLKENRRPSQSILKRSKSDERPRAANSKLNSRIVSGKKKNRKPESNGNNGNNGDNGNEIKAVRIKRKTKAPEGAKVLMSVKREPELGSGDGDLDIYEDDWEGMEGHDRPTGKDASRRYVHEKSIFQELTHLKRMQIQYGKVQEKILVRSLVSNFCKMHGLDPVNFKFQTFYAWEKFLYDQLKSIYLDERTRLAHTSHARATRMDRFETRLRQARAVPLNEKVSRMSKVYGSSTMTSGSVRKERDVKIHAPVCGQGGKRCDCLGKHLLIKQK